MTTEEQRHGRHGPQSIHKHTQHLLELALALAKVEHTAVRSDDHRSYPPAIRAVSIPGHEVKAAAISAARRTSSKLAMHDRRGAL